MRTLMKTLQVTKEEVEFVWEVRENWLVLPDVENTDLVRVLRRQGGDHSLALQELTNMGFIWSKN